MVQWLPVWGDRGGLPKGEYDGLRRLLPGARVLAWGTGQDTVVVGTAGHLAWRDADGWHADGWHEILRGSWERDESVLRWQARGESAREVALAEPGQVPGLMKDRVNASIVAEERLTAAGVQVIITARRRLDDASAPVEWFADAVDGRTLDRSGVRAEVDARLSVLRADLGS